MAYAVTNKTRQVYSARTTDGEAVLIPAGKTETLESLDPATLALVRRGVFAIQPVSKQQPQQAPKQEAAANKTSKNTST